MFAILWLLSLGYPWGMFGLSFGKGTARIRRGYENGPTKYAAKVRKKFRLCKFYVNFVRE